MMVGNKIKLKRESRNMSRKELAKMSGLSSEVIAQYERGDTSPSVKSMVALSSALSTPLSFLFDFEKLPLPPYAKNILFLRSSRRWTLSRLGAEVFVSPETIHKWETGTTIPSAQDIINLAKVFAVSPIYILENTIF